MNPLDILLITGISLFLLWRARSLQKERDRFSRWAQKDREADASFWTVFYLREAGVSSSHPIFRKAQRKWRALQKEAENLRTRMT